MVARSLTFQLLICLSIGIAAEPRGLTPHTKAQTVSPQLLWHFQSDEQMLTSATPAGDRLYVASDSGFVYAIDRVLGHVVWATATDDPILSAPAASQGAIYAMNGDVIALDAKDGVIRLRVRSGRYQPAVSVRVNTRTIFIAGTERGRGFVDALDSEVASPRWRWSTSEPIVAPVALFSSVVVAGTRGGELVGLDPDSGELLWSIVLGGPITAPAVTSQGIAYVRHTERGGLSIDGPGGESGVVSAVDVARGEVLWRVEVPAGSAAMAGAVSNGVLVICVEDLLLGLAIVDGAEVWRLVMPQSIVTPIAAGEGLIFAGDTTGYFYAIEANSGVERWRFATANGIISAATVANGVVYVSSGGSLYALNTLAEDNVPVQ